MMKRIFFLLSLLAASFGYAETFEENVVYLASFPRSGNHWVRYLVEEASHIITCSSYRDYNPEHPHYPNRFLKGTYSPQNGYNGFCRYPNASESVLLKTHYPFLPKPTFSTETTKICLIRNPIDSFYSFYAYRQKYVFKKKIEEKIPSEVVAFFVQSWRNFYEFWEAQENVLFIRYEDLYQDPKFYLAKILETLKYKIQPTDIDRAVNLFPPIGDILKHINCYEQKDLEFIRRELGDLLEKYHYDL